MIIRIAISYLCGGKSLNIKKSVCRNQSKNYSNSGIATTKNNISISNYACYAS